MNPGCIPAKRINPFVAWLKYIPGFNRFAWPVKIGVTAVLALICVFLLIPVSNKPSELARELLAYSPVPEAEGYFEKQGPKAAYDFITFYKGLPGASARKEIIRGLNEIQAKAEKERSSWGYRAKELGLGLLGLEHHEGYGDVAQSFARAIPYGKDIHEISRYVQEYKKAWDNYLANGKTDVLHLGLVTLGLAETVAGVFGSNDTLNSIKKTTNALIQSVSVMSDQLKTVIEKVLNPAFTELDKLHLSTLMSDPSVDSIYQFARDTKDTLYSVIDSTQQSLNKFSQLANLPPEARNAAVASSSSVGELDQNSILAAELVKLDPKVLLYGGEAALRAFAWMKANDKVDIKALQAAMVFGTPGLNAIGQIPLADLEADFAKIEKPASGSQLFLVLRVVLFIAAILVLLKTWLYPARRPGYVNAR